MKQEAATYPPDQIFRMKRREDSSYIHYVKAHANNRQWFRLFAFNIKDHTTDPLPGFIKMEKSDLINDISKEVFEYELALLKSEVFQTSPMMNHCTLLPQMLPMVLDSIKPEDTFLLYVFTESCSVCKYTTPLVAHLAAKLNKVNAAGETEVKVLSIYGYRAVLALTNEAWIMDDLGVPKFYLFEGKREPTLLHNPDLLGDYKPDEMLANLQALFEKEVAL